MAETTKIPKTTNRYGTRYGARNRNKVALVENQYKQGQKCPYCKNESVARNAPGIFSCSKCGAKFTGRAYSIESSAKFITEEKEQQ